MPHTTRMTQVSRDQRPTRRQTALLALVAGPMITQSHLVPMSLIIIG
jgi:hypothetical protein